MQPEIEIYTSQLCGFCFMAKRLLEQKGVGFKEYDVTLDRQLRDTMTERAGGRTSVPQIFINGRHIGGCDDLHALDTSGKLDNLLTQDTA